jgi:predicted nuclease of predicted toxin-antitoxin system
MPVVCGTANGYRAARGVILWLDAQLPPRLAAWLSTRFGVEAVALRDLGLRDSTDAAIFAAARRAGVVIVSKDSDFVDVVERHGPPPHLLWLTCGNLTNSRLQAVFERTFEAAAALVRDGRAVVEISDRNPLSA